MIASGFSAGQLALTMLISAGLGVVVGILLSPRARLARELTKKLQESEEKLTHYQNTVTDHFLKTSDHFQSVTTEYQRLFTHLRDGAHQLCSDDRLREQLNLIHVPTQPVLDVDLDIAETSVDNSPITAAD